MHYLTGRNVRGRVLVPLRALAIVASLVLASSLTACGPSQEDILRDENEELRYSLERASQEEERLREENDELRDALERANEVIETAASEIESAQVYLGGSYDDLAFALRSIDVPYRIDEP